MFDQSLLDKLKERYSQVHPLMFQRSVEKAKSAGELFDILDLISQDYPLIWDENERRWVSTKDIFQISKFDLGVKI